MTLLWEVLKGVGVDGPGGMGKPTCKRTTRTNFIFNFAFLILHGYYEETICTLFCLHGCFAWIFCIFCTDFVRRFFCTDYLPRIFVRIVCTRILYRFFVRISARMFWVFPTHLLGSAKIKSRQCFGGFLGRDFGGRRVRWRFWPT